jgi:Ferritin-like
MDAEKRQLFLKDTLTKQLNARDGSWDNDDMTPIGDLTSALSALELIIDQGEGTDGTHKHCHFQVFRDIAKKYFPNSPGNPDLLQYYDVMENIDAKDYKDQPGLYEVCLHLLGVEYELKIAGCSNL